MYVCSSGQAFGLSLKAFFLCECVAGGVLLGEMVLIAIRGQHMGAE